MTDEDGLFSGGLLGGGLPVDTNPTLRLGLANQRIKERFPALGSFEFDVIPGEGEGFAEFFPADEKFNPNPGRATIQIRKMDLPQPELESIILGEALHLAPDRLPEFKKLKDEFKNSMQLSQRGVLVDMFMQDDSKRSFSQFVDQVGADAFIRDFFFQKEGAIPGGKPFVSGLGPIMGAFFPKQIEILEKMRSLLRKKAK